jgi:hypothetical protein
MINTFNSIQCRDFPDDVGNQDIGSHSGEEDVVLLGCDAVWTHR